MSGTFDFTIEQGADLDLAFACKDDQGLAVSLVGYTVRGFVYTTDAAAPVLDLAPEFVDEAAGTISIHVTAANTETLTGWASGTWTLEAVNGAQVLRLLKGRVTLSERIDPWL